MVLQLLRKLILIRRFWWDNFSVFGVLQHGTIPVIGPHCSKKNSVLEGHEWRSISLGALRIRNIPEQEDVTWKNVPCERLFQFYQLFQTSDGEQQDWSRSRRGVWMDPMRECLAAVARETRPTGSEPQMDPVRTRSFSTHGTLCFPHHTRF